VSALSSEATHLCSPLPSCFATGKLSFVRHGCQHVAASDSDVKERVFGALPNGNSLAQLSAIGLEELAREDLSGPLADALHKFGSSIVGERGFVV